MPKKKILKKQSLSLRDMRPIKLKTTKGLSEFSAIKIMQDKELIANALWECLKDNDIESFKDILNTHLEMTNKNELAKRTGIARRTLFRMLSPEGNPTLDNLGKIIHELCA